MQHKLNKTDSRRVATLEKFLKNANHLLKKKSLEEQNEIFDIQEKIIAGISNIEFRESLLKQFKELRGNASIAKKKFDSIIDNLMNCDKILAWKSLDETIQFFDEVDNDITYIPDQRMRHQLIKQSEYWKTSKLDESITSSISKILYTDLENNLKLAWDTKEKIEVFFNWLNTKIQKISDSDIRKNLFWMSALRKMSANAKIDSEELKVKKSNITNNPDAPDWLKV